MVLRLKNKPDQFFWKNKAREVQIISIYHRHYLLANSSIDGALTKITEVYKNNQYQL